MPSILTGICSLIRVSSLTEVWLGLDVSKRFLFAQTLSLTIKISQPYQPLTLGDPLLNFNPLPSLSAPNNNKNKQISKREKKKKRLQFQEVPEQLCSSQEETLEHQWTVISNCHFTADFSEKHHPAKTLLLNANLVTARIIQGSVLPFSLLELGVLVSKCINSRDLRWNTSSINKLQVMERQMEQGQIFKRPCLSGPLPHLVQNSQKY